MKKMVPIFETIPFENPTITEVEVNGQKFMRVRGVFGRADERNANNRIYPSKLVERENKALSERAGKDSVFMQADHPSDGVSRISDTAAVLRSVEYDPKTKEVVGEADVLKTHKGADLAEIIRAGGKVGISARGFGTTSVGEHAGQKGEIVNEDYKLVTYDFVVGQSTRGAVVTNFAEQARALSGLTEDEMEFKDLTLDALKTARPDLVTALTTEAKTAAQTESDKQLEAKLAEKVVEITAKLKDELKLEWGKNKGGGGKGGGSKGLKDDDEEIDKSEQMIHAAARFGYRIEATTATDKERYGGGKGRTGKGKEDGKSSDLGDEDQDGPNEQELVAWAKEHKLKLEKKSEGKSSNKDQKDDDMEERFNALKSQLKDATVVIEQTQSAAKKLEEQLLQNDIRAYIFEKVAGEGRLKNALTERLLKANYKTKAEVDAAIPTEKGEITRLITEATGHGIAAADEPLGSGENAPKTYKTKEGKTLTEAQLRERSLAGLKTELVEQAQ